MTDRRTVVALSKEARAAVDASMKRRGETADTYFSGAGGGRFVDQRIVESRAGQLGEARMVGVPGGNQVAVFDENRGYTSKAVQKEEFTGAPSLGDGYTVRATGTDIPAVQYVGEDQMYDFEVSRLRAGLGSAADDFSLARNLFDSPANSKARAAANAEAYRTIAESLAAGGAEATREFAAKNEGMLRSSKTLESGIQDALYQRTPAFRKRVISETEAAGAESVRKKRLAEDFGRGAQLFSTLREQAALRGRSK